MNEHFRQLADLYGQMESAYQTVASVLDFSCDGCSDNCCDSYFLHHTYIEWAYLWEGLGQLEQDKKELYQKRAQDYVSRSQQALAKSERPMIMCPVNDNGLCGLYHNRLLICRLHGVPSSITMPNARSKTFPGCFRCQEIIQDKKNVTTMDRTRFFREMVLLEQSFMENQRPGLPRVKMTLAEMLIKEPFSR